MATSGRVRFRYLAAAQISQFWLVSLSCNLMHILISVCFVILCMRSFVLCTVYFLCFFSYPFHHFQWILALLATLEYCNGQNNTAILKRMHRITDNTFSNIHANLRMNRVIVRPSICATVLLPQPKTEIWEKWIWRFSSHAMFLKWFTQWLVFYF